MADPTESRALRTLVDIVESGRPLIYIRSAEEQRVTTLLRESAGRCFSSAVPLWTWSLTDGMRRDDGTGGELLGPRAALDFIATYDGRAFFLLKDFHEPMREAPDVRRRLRDLYARARVVVVPLHDVDFDAGVTTITEAMAMGRAVVVTRTRGQVDVVRDGETGLYVPPGDPAALRAAVRYLLDHPAEAARMGRHGRALAESRHTLDGWVTAVADVVTARSGGALDVPPTAWDVADTAPTSASTAALVPSARTVPRIDSSPVVRCLPPA